MGRRDREQKQKLIVTAARVREAGGEHALERWRALRRTSGCREADRIQARDMLRMGAAWKVVECPHCGRMPDLEPVFLARGPCGEVGHPEQAFRVLEGIPLVRCVLCGETPAVQDTGASPKLAAMLQIMRYGGMPTLGT